MPADDPVRKLALAALDADAQVRELLAPGVEAARIPFSVLYRYASDPDFKLVATDAEKLASDPVARADLERLISTNALIHMPRQAAAASGDVRRRETEVAILTLTRSKADADHIYLGIELRDTETPPPVVMFVATPGAAWLRLALPAFSSLRAQVLLEAGGDMARTLSDPGAEVYLR